MAVPTGAYQTKSIYARSLDNTTDVQTMVAILQTDKATMLSRFALDGLFNVNVDGTNDGVVGFCRINSPNYTRHLCTTSRIGNLRLFDGTSDCVLFNDAGLNTCGYCTVSVLKWPANQLKLTGYFQSSYYEASSDMGYEFKLDSGAWYTLYYPRTPVVGLNANFTETIWMGIGGTQGQQCTVRTYVVNPNGKFTGNEVTGTLTTPIYSYMAKFGSTPSSAVNGSAITVYMSQTDYNNLATVVTAQASVTGIYGYTDPDMTIKTPAGSYAYLNNSANTSSKVRTYTASSTGEFNQYVDVTTTPSKDMSFGLGTSNGMIQLFVSMNSGTKTTDTTFTVKIDALSSPWNGTTGQMAMVGGGSTSGTVTANTTGMSKVTLIQDQRSVAGSGIGGYKITVTALSPTYTYDTTGL